MALDSCIPAGMTAFYADAINPFHWEIEFPEVFQRENPGFDAFVGNPPFAGKNTLINGNRAGYLDWLKTLHEETHGNADLVAHFFRRAFDLLRPDGAFGLIATNTIGQGDTRSTGLRWICTHGGMIYWARKRYRWPGAAAVVVSVVHVHKSLLILKSPPTPLFQRGEIKDSSNPLLAKADLLNPPLAKGGRGDLTIELDGRPVEKITAYLFHAGGHDDPKPLKTNAGKSFIGSYVLGMGFTFDDTDSKGVASPLAEMRRLIEHNPKNAERIFPYIGGEEVNDSPTHAHHRYVINFADFPLRREAIVGGVSNPAPSRLKTAPTVAYTWADADDKQREAWLRTGIVPLDYPGPVAADWPALLGIVEGKMKGSRETHSTAQWWRFERLRGELYEAIRGLDRVLVVSRVGNAFAWAFLPSNTVMSERLVVAAGESLEMFSYLQSRIHELWSRLYGSSLKDDLMYAPSDCFETFPFPLDYESNPDLETTGRDYYEFRAELMVKNNEGLTKTYNRFHDPNETAPDILKLRELHTAMDRAVLDAYGWADIPTNCVFLLDWEDEDEDDSGRGGKRKKPWRYRWSDEVRDEVLARLLALNAERAAAEERAGQRAFAVAPKPPKALRKGGKPKPDNPNMELDF